MQWLTGSRATITAAPNFAYDIVGRYGCRVEDADLSHLRFAISGDEPIDPDAFDAFLDVAARFGMERGTAAPAYGMAESTCAVSLPSAGEGAQYDEVTVTSPDGGGNPVRRRYAPLGKHAPLGDGEWFPTGDLGYLVDDGFGWPTCRHGWTCSGTR
ncbi:hypothetical protein AB1460_33250 [Parafrankia sp. FMc2]